jgi:hypothetical protein
MFCYGNDTSLAVEDLFVIQNIESSFSSILKNKCDGFTNLIDFSNRTSELIGCLQFNNEIALLLFFVSYHVRDRNKQLILLRIENFKKK